MDKPFAITLDVGSSLANRTGSWRTNRPLYVDRLPPCNNACPAGENIQSWLYHAESSDYEAAWRVLTQDNPLPAVMGRVCYHPCENECNRARLDTPVGINSVERFLGDEAIRRGWRFPAPARESGKRVLIVGAGPSGLSAAYHLRRLGHRVAIHEAGTFAGGMMRFGIPKYRLPRDVLDAEVRRILDTGVELVLDTKVDNILSTMRMGEFDAAFLAVGAHIGKRAYIPAGSAAKVLDAISVLRSMEGEEHPMLGRRVVVYGGGNTALDVARTAKRLGATEAVIVYRRTRERMPAHDFEVEEALQEGVLIKWLSTIKQADGASITVEKMALDAKGFPQPTGEFETLAADSVVLALGQDVDLSLLDGVPGLELRLPLLFSLGVQAKRISLPQFVQFTATSHAKTYGLYPRKGTIAVGADADIAIWDPEKKLAVESTHDNTGYTPYKGRMLAGWPVTVLSRGEVIVDDGKLSAARGRGRFLPRDPSEALRPLGREVPEISQLRAWNTPLEL